MTVNTSQDLADNRVVVLDFETSGLSPNQGDRAIEIGAVRIESGRVTDTFQKLMNPGFRIDGFISSFTGITNDMLSRAAPNNEVMTEFSEFIGNDNLVAHNASFDKRFLEAEYELLGKDCLNPFACSMLIARRIYPSAPNHKLEGLIRYKGIKNDGSFHRALADSTKTADLWLCMIGDIQEDFGINEVSFSMMRKIASMTKSKVPEYLSKQAKLVEDSCSVAG